MIKTSEKSQIESIIEPRFLYRSRAKIMGVYFLFRNEEIVYIGQSKNIISRISQHFLNKDFDSFSYIEIKNFQTLIKMESEFIKKHKPFYNKSGKELKEKLTFLTIQIPKSLKMRIKKIAKQKGISISKQTIFLINQSLEPYNN